MKRAVILIITAFLLSACAKKSMTVLVPTEDNGFELSGTVGTINNYSMRELTTTEKTDMIMLVKSAEGTKYVWGGNAPEEGIDCSGLIVWAYGKLGFPGFRNGDEVVLDITSNDMFTYDVSKSVFVTVMSDFLNYETGDLLFLDINHDQKVDHVAVFMHYDPETETVWIWDASTNKRGVAYRPVTGILAKNPRMGKPMMPESKLNPIFADIQ